MNKHFVIGLDIGGTRCKAGLVDISSGEVLQSEVFPTEKDDEDLFFQKLREKCSNIANYAESPIEGIGVGVLTYVFADGSVDSTGGYVPFLDFLPLARRIKELTGYRCLICNDAEAAAQAEALYGAGRGCSRVLTLTLGTGIGVGFTVDGKSQNKEAAIHLAGHIKVRNGGELSNCLDDPPCYCAVSGCFESSCSGSSFSRLAGYYFGKNDSTVSADRTDLSSLMAGEMIFKMAKSGDERALVCIRWFLDKLICALNQYVYIFCPDIIVLGGGLSNSLGPWFNELNMGLKAMVYANQRIKVVPATLKEEGGILGAASLFVKA